MPTLWEPLSGSTLAKLLGCFRQILLHVLIVSPFLWCLQAPFVLTHCLKHSLTCCTHHQVSVHRNVSFMFPVDTGFSSLLLGFSVKKKPPEFIISVKPYSSVSMPAAILTCIGAAEGSQRPWCKFTKRSEWRHEKTHRGGSARPQEDRSVCADSVNASYVCCDNAAPEWSSCWLSAALTVSPSLADRRDMLHATWCRDKTVDFLQAFQANCN